MQGRPSEPVDLFLHAIRLLGFAGAGAIARRFGQDSEEVQELLLDLEASGWVTRSEFAGSGGWSLTEAGRSENRRRLAAERDQDAFVRASRGERRWVDALGIDSCHTVWMQLHDDLLATLDLERGFGELNELPRPIPETREPPHGGGSRWWAIQELTVFYYVRRHRRS